MHFLNFFRFWSVFAGAVVVDLRRIWRKRATAVDTDRREQVSSRDWGVSIGTEKITRWDSSEE